ncbi:methyltransferase [Halorubrum sp. JWXQ-INN 858]|uniref:class I SAM-dependent methyltransferase n=1 Tax=Halorubrum sp. JWXQ-INN 858 TaxID=2690782 RepID=UPI001359C055|nr:class I SAM-dependent methyltransferase [Halorubrum sp. JWXQ-INN 858]MWV64745.1 methyltransferase [Halorubrum sp. JWXQ-INN 858]
MTGIDRRPEAESEYADRLRRSERLWNRWSDWYRLSERDFEPIRRELIDRLGIERGDAVLEIGCGPGVNFEPIRAAIGEEGRLVAIDYSPDMVAKATARVDERGWENVTVVRADATTADLGGPYDVAVATLCLSLLPDVGHALRNVYDALEPGGVLGVLDLQPFQSGPARVLNPLVCRFLWWYANWNPDADVPGAVAAVFDDVERLDTHLYGTAYTIRATRSAGPT